MFAGQAVRAMFARFSARRNSAAISARSVTVCIALRQAIDSSYISSSVIGTPYDAMVNGLCTMECGQWGGIYAEQAA